VTRRARRRRVALPVAGLALAFAGLAAGAGPAAAHTGADVIAVPAGEQVTIHLRPEHGCGESPTVDVAVRAPVAGATAGEVPGWTATATPDGEDRTVLEWKGGSLPADQEGEFPVSFTAPDQVGELLLFPAVQTCEDGQELAWISGDPEGDYPAPRLLILPAGREAADALDEVPPDAPGREKLTQVIDVATPTTTAAPTTTTEGGSATTSTTAATATDDASASDASAGADAGDTGDDGSDAPNTIVLAVIAIVVVVGGGAVLAWRTKGR
jgi:uncharacterized protein YcnI